jgi:hypothetical protein
VLVGTAASLGTASLPGSGCQAAYGGRGGRVLRRPRSCAGVAQLANPGAAALGHKAAQRKPAAAAGARRAAGSAGNSQRGGCAGAAAAVVSCHPRHDGRAHPQQLCCGSLRRVCALRHKGDSTKSFSWEVRHQSNLKGRYGEFVTLFQSFSLSCQSSSLHKLPRQPHNRVA